MKDSGGNHLEGISNLGSLVLTNDMLSGFHASAITNQGTVILSHSIVSHNDETAIDNEGVLTVTESTISHNAGGGIHSSGTMTITDSLISENTSEAGGGIYSEGSMTITNSTISDNTSTGYAGGIANLGTLTLFSSTIAHNRAQSTGGGILNGFSGFNGKASLEYCTIYDNTAQFGGGIANDSAAEGVEMAACIVAGDHASTGPDIQGMVALKAGPSLIQSVSPQQLVPSADDLNGSYAVQSTIVGKSPKLGPLQNNGGPTPTYALLPGSPAIDAVEGSPDDPLCSNGYYPNLPDQRGMVRPDDQEQACDIGAYESSG
jgi:predicted outer membrane repeat protein